MQFKFLNLLGQIAPYIHSFVYFDLSEVLKRSLQYWVYLKAINRVVEANCKIQTLRVVKNKVVVIVVDYTR